MAPEDVLGMTILGLSPHGDRWSRFRAWEGEDYVGDKCGVFPQSHSVIYVPNGYVYTDTLCSFISHIDLLIFHTILSI